MGVMESSTMIAVLVVTMMITLTDAHQFSLVHKYAHLEGSAATSQGRGASLEHTALLRAHDRRRLDAFFALDGRYEVGLYYTAIMLGTPPQQYHVYVDTGSDLMWVHCVPCTPNCPLRTEVPGITLRLYDPTLSSSDVVLGCTDANCAIASYGQPGQCRVTPPGACSYSIGYGDGSSTKGYLIQDVLTFQDSPNTTTSSNVYFGCGTNQTGLLLETALAVDGIIGFGQAAHSVSTQLADQGKVGKMFAHCLQGDTVGGGNLVIDNITEPNITYTPMVPQQPHYNVYLRNIAVNGVNITNPASFAITPYANLGVIVDSGTSFGFLIQPAHSQFVAAIKSGAPVPSEQVWDGRGDVTCWFYSGDIATTFPSVTLIFDGASMTLAPKNYLMSAVLETGESVWCIAWQESTIYTIIGDIVLKDQLVVYDNYNHLIGWKPFNCALPIPVV